MNSLTKLLYSSCSFLLLRSFFSTFRKRFIAAALLRPNFSISSLNGNSTTNRHYLCALWFDRIEFHIPSLRLRDVFCRERFLIPKTLKLGLQCSLKMQSVTYWLKLENCFPILIFGQVQEQSIQREIHV